MRRPYHIYSPSLPSSEDEGKTKLDTLDRLFAFQAALQGYILSKSILATMSLVRSFRVNLT
jgi:hypothetical protein